LRQAENLPKGLRQVTGLLRRDPGINHEHGFQESGVFVQPMDQVFPIDVLAPSVNKIENVSPITMVPLNDIKFAPKEFLHRNDLELFTADGDFACSGEPGGIHLCALVGHGPDNIDDDTGFDTAIDPVAIIGATIVVIREAGFGQGGDDSIAVQGSDIEIDILGISPTPRKCRECKATAEKKVHAGFADGNDRFAIDFPLVTGDGAGPAELKLGEGARDFKRAADGGDPLEAADFCAVGGYRSSLAYSGMACLNPLPRSFRLDHG